MDILFTECSSIQQHLTEITRAFSRLCSTNATAPTYSATWNSVSMTGIGGINFVTTNAQSFLIPSVIPDTASEVLLYIEIIAGISQQGKCIIKIFTEESDDRRFEKYLSISTWHQHSYTMTEDNMWFPFMENRRVYVKLSNSLTQTQYVSGNIYVIGYR